MQALVNLVGNAIKFTEAGRVTVGIGAADGFLRFSVEDSGIGMTAEAAARVFAPFEQADGSTTRRFGGSGLGLAIACELVHLMGGTIGVESAPGAGSRFWFTIPTEAPAAAAPLPAPADAARRAVLLVEDNPVNTKIARAMLEAEGCVVTCAVDGAAAVAAYAPGAFAIVLMDCQMPVMDGLEATRRIRAAERASGAPPTPIVALTANTVPEDLRRAREAGMDGVIGKPVTAAELAAILARHVSGPARYCVARPETSHDVGCIACAPSCVQATGAPALAMRAARGRPSSQCAAMKRVALTPFESSEASQTIGRTMTSGWISLSRGISFEGSIIRVFTGPPGTSTLVETPLPSRSCAMIRVIASSAALVGP